MHESRHSKQKCNCSLFVLSHNSRELSKRRSLRWKTSALLNCNEKLRHREGRCRWCPISGFKHLGNDPKRATSGTFVSWAWGWWDNHEARQADSFCRAGNGMRYWRMRPLATGKISPKLGCRSTSDIPPSWGAQGHPSSNHVLHPSKPEELHPMAAQQWGETPLQPPLELTSHKQRRFWCRRH